MLEMFWGNTWSSPNPSMVTLGFSMGLAKVGLARGGWLSAVDLVKVERLSAVGVAKVKRLSASSRTQTKSLMVSRIFSTLIGRAWEGPVSPSFMFPSWDV
jgi:hypothetical protein